MATTKPGERRRRAASGSPAKDAGPSYHHGNLRAALIEAGLAALEETDRAELSLRDLARRAGVSATAAYHHFANKEALLSALAAEGFRRIGAATTYRPPPPGVPPAERLPREEVLRGAGRAYVRFAMTHPALFRLMYGGFTAAHNDPELVEAAMGGFSAMLDGVAAYSGRDPQDPQVLQDGLMLWTIAHGLAHLALGGQLGYFAADPMVLVDMILARSPLPVDRPAV